MAPGSQEDAALLEGLRTGEAGAFEALVRTFGGQMRAVAYRLLRDGADADDVVQEAFLSAYRSLDDFESRSRLGTWLHRITINAALMKLRSRERRKEADLGTLVPEFADTGAFLERQCPWQEAADAPTIREETRQAIRGYIDELPENYRVPLVLRDIEGLAHRVIAEALGITVNSAKLRVHRARQALRSRMEPFFAEMA